jgi:hypothetical protein
MNTTELRAKVGWWAARAKQESGQPSASTIETLKLLWNEKRNLLSNNLKSKLDVKWHVDPDWDSWSSIATHFEAYHAALFRFGHPVSRSHEQD